MSTKHAQGLKAARMLMVLSSLSPLFILWAIRGNDLVPDRYFLPGCALAVLLPNLFLLLRANTAWRLKERRELVVGRAEDHRDHILVYLFAMLLPFYSEDLSSWRYLASSFAALAFIVFLFWHLNLHYMNLFFALFDYRVFTVQTPDDGNRISGKGNVALITRRVNLSPGERIVALHLSDTVFWERPDEAGV